MQMPAPLKSGATVGIVSPASPIAPEKLEKAVAWFERRGFRVKQGKSVHTHDRFLAGSDDARAEDINAFFADPSVDAVFASRGGYGTPRLLGKIDYNLIRQNPKIFVGLSDTTALQNALLAKSGLLNYSGFIPSLDLKNGEILPVTELSLNAALNHEPQSFPGQTLFTGSTSGRLIGGCLSLFVCLAGTPYMPETANSILILEDVGEDPYRIDRMLAHLELAGIFNQVNGVVFGEFFRCVSKDPEDGTIEDVLNEWGKRIGKPVLKGIPYGHQPNHCVVPLGGAAVIEDGNLILSGKI